MGIRSIFASLLTVLVSAGATAEIDGGIVRSGSTGGGFTVVCPETPVSEKSVTLLDFYEAEHQLGFEIREGAGTLMEEYFLSVDRTYTAQGRPDLAESLEEDIEENLVKFFQSVKFVETSVELPPAHDMGPPPWIPAECSFEQVAFYDDARGRVFIYSKLWDQLSSTAQAALVQHELWGREYRRHGELDSGASRNVVAHLFRKKALGPVIVDRPSTATRYSAGGALMDREIKALASFWTQKTVGGEFGENLRLTFDHFYGRAYLVDTWAEVPYVDWKFEMVSESEKPFFLRCILKTQGIHFRGEVPLHGTMADGASVRYKFKTGEPVLIALVRDGKKLSQGEINYCP